jgi:dihydropteroate synthase
MTVDSLKVAPEVKAGETLCPVRPFDRLLADWGARSAQRCLVMGILNVTPDSFSDGGRYLDVRRAVEHGHAMARAGADIVDIGGESTRPGATRVSAEEELRRVLPVARELASAGVAVSIDTMRAEVAEAAVSVGAQVVNDVSGGSADPSMGPCVAELGVPFVAMHWRAHSSVMRHHTRYHGDVVAVVRAELAGRIDALLRCGVELDRIVIDPGIGFAKEASHNWALLSRLPELSSLGRPILVGASRKRFLREATDDSGWDAGTASVSALVAAAGAQCVRVHDVAGSLAAVRVARHWQSGS